MTIAAVLLAAGRGRRFGGAKLAAPLGGRSLVLHAASTLALMPIAIRIAVVSPDTPDLAPLGFDCVELGPLDAPLSRSLQLGIERAIASGAERVVVALADMPFVPLSHFQALLEAFDGRGIATRANGVAMPPALFGPALLAATRGIEGDRGARSLLQGLPAVDLAADLALDIDTPADLQRAERLLMRH